ncbi:hypothetical protein GCM10027361_00540 [Erwinia aphidicola]|uniref:hypothetical protein n=1 Tax=Erwinia aphidicola TaxID=68334 RepID=UPI00174617D0|nr:hypothetical protein [Erwinia aphidicola]MBD1377229.1 hypothetical protein [Erwinia aphidicola]
MNIKFTCDYFTTGSGVRPGELQVTAEGVVIQDVIAKEVLMDMDIRDIFDFLASQGYTVQEQHHAA